MMCLLTTCGKVRATKHQLAVSNLCAMTTIVDALEGLDSDSLFAVCNV